MSKRERDEEKVTVEEEKYEREMPANLNTKRHVSYKERLARKIVAITILIAIMVTTVFLFFSRNQIVSIRYQEQSSVDFSVFLHENDYFDTLYLPRDMQYIASLIDTVNVVFNYSFDANDYMDYVYRYYVEAHVVVFEQNNPNNIIFQQRQNITDVRTVELNHERNFLINKQLEIDYSEYNDLIRSFMTSYNINASSNLVLSLNVEVEGTNERIDEVINTSNQMELTIPLTEQMINIEMAYNDINNNDIISGQLNRNMKDYIIIAVFGVTLIILVITLARLARFIELSSEKKTAYQKVVNNLLKEFDRVIVESKKVIDLGDDPNIIEVKTFEELLDVSDKIGQPIIYMEIHKNQKSWFIVKNGEDIYRYILKSVDLER